MFGFLKKDKVKDESRGLSHSEKEITELFDDFIGKLYINKHQNERNIMLGLKNKILEQEWDSQIVNAVYDLLESIKSSALIDNKAFISLNIENINDIMNLSKDDIANGNVLSNMKKNYAINNELFLIELKISQTNEKMDRAMDSGNKLLWTRLKNNINSLNSEHKLKTQYLTNLNNKTQSLRIKSSILETSDSLKDLAQEQGIDFQEVTEAVSNNETYQSLIDDETVKMMELMGGDEGVNDDDDFEIAQRQRLLQKAADDFEEIPKKIKEEV